MTSVLATYRPFLDPLFLHAPWHSLVLMAPLVVGIALVYKALKAPSLERLGHETVQLSFYILAMMLTAAGVLWAVIEFV